MLWLKERKKIAKHTTHTRTHARHNTPTHARQTEITQHNQLSLARLPSFLCSACSELCKPVWESKNAVQVWPHSLTEKESRPCEEGEGICRQAYRSDRLWVVLSRNFNEVPSGRLIDGAHFRSVMLASTMSSRSPFTAATILQLLYTP
jgi:hypothetical protein